MDWLILALLSAVFAALTAIFGKIGVSGVDSNVATAARTVIMTVTIMGLVVIQGKFSQLFQFNSRTFLFVVLSALAGAASWLVYFKALQLGQASQVAPIDKLSLVFTVILAAVFLGEGLTLTKLAGSLLMVGGALLIIK